jgi:DNA-binding MarR family transcriptional regulator
LPASKQIFRKAIFLLPASAQLLDVETAGRLRAALGRVQRLLRSTPAATAAGLTPTKISILFTVLRAGPIRVSDLATEESINPTMLSRVVAGLTDGDLVTRISDPSDRRAALLEVTPAGRRLAERIRRERTDALNAAIAPLDPRDRAALERALPALEALAEQLRGGRRS